MSASSAPPRSRSRSAASPIASGEADEAAAVTGDVTHGVSVTAGSSSSNNCHINGHTNRNINDHTDCNINAVTGSISNTPTIGSASGRDDGTTDGQTGSHTNGSDQQACLEGDMAAFSAAGSVISDLVGEDQVESCNDDGSGVDLQSGIGSLSTSRSSSNRSSGWGRERGMTMGCDASEFASIGSSVGASRSSSAPAGVKYSGRLSTLSHSQRHRHHSVAVSVSSRGKFQEHSGGVSGRDASEKRFSMKRVARYVGGGGGGRDHVFFRKLRWTQLVCRKGATNSQNPKIMEDPVG